MKDKTFIVWDEKVMSGLILFPFPSALETGQFFPEFICFLPNYPVVTKTHNQHFAFQRILLELQMHWEHDLPFMLLWALANVSPCCKAQISLFSVSSMMPYHQLLDPNDSNTCFRFLLRNQHHQDSQLVTTPKLQIFRGTKAQGSCFPIYQQLTIRM